MVGVRRKERKLEKREASSGSLLLFRSLFQTPSTQNSRFGYLQLRSRSFLIFLSAQTLTYSLLGLQSLSDSTRSASSASSSSHLLPSSMPRVAIIGAGFSGLTTTKYLIDFGHQVQIFELSADIGGVWSASRFYPVSNEAKSTQHRLQIFSFRDTF